MSELRKYGVIWIAAGIAVTGTLWFDRSGADVRGEDYAELLAAATERGLAYHTGTNAYAFASNALPSAVRWSDLYGKVMDAGRAMATNNGGPVLWLDASGELPEDGDYLVTGQQSWHVASTSLVPYTASGGNTATQTVYVWEPGAAVTNAADMLAAAGTLVPADGIWYWPGMETNRLPFAALCAGVSSNASLGIAWEHGNWWTRIGNGTNVYRYTAEVLKNFNDETVEFRPVAQFGYELDWPTNVVFAYGEKGWKSVGVRQRGIVYSGHSVGLYSVACDGRDTAYFAASDSGAPLSHTVSSKRLALAEEGSTTFTVRRPSVISSPVVTYITTVGGSNVQVEPSQLIYYPTNWSVPQTVTVTAPADGDDEHGAALIKLQTGAFSDYLVVSVEDGGDNPHFELNPDLLTTGKGDSAPEAVRILIQQTNGYVSCTQAISTQNLNQAKAVMSGMTRTVAILSPSALSFTNGIEASWSATTNISYESDEAEFPSDQSGTLYAAVKADILNGTSVTSAPTFWDAEGEWQIGQVRIWTQLLGETIVLHDSGDPPYHFESCDEIVYADADWRGIRLEGASLPYPSLYACASGYVASVSIYAAARCERVGVLVEVDPDRTAYELSDYSGTPFDLSGMASAASAMFMPCPSIANPENRRISAAAFDRYGYGSGGQQVRLHKIGTWLSPEVQPVFDLDFSTPSVSGDSPAEVAAAWTRYDETGSYSESYQLRQRVRDFSASVHISHFIVVVDWIWRHANDSVPYEPELWTPEWATTNAP